MAPDLVDLIRVWLFESCLFIHWQAIHEDTRINFSDMRDNNIGYMTSDCSYNNVYVMIYDDKVITHNLLGERNKNFQASDPEFFDKLGSELKFLHNNGPKNCVVLL